MISTFFGIGATLNGFGLKVMRAKIGYRMPHIGHNCEIAEDRDFTKPSQISIAQKIKWIGFAAARAIL